MLPRFHILYGALFTILIWIFSPEINPYYLALIFLSSFLIDFDHYASAVLTTKKTGLKNALDYHKKMAIIMVADYKKGIKKKYNFHLFHTIEFHILIAVLGLIWTAFFFIFIGMVFHSMLDILDGLWKDTLYRRQYIFFDWLRKKI